MPNLHNSNPHNKCGFKSLTATFDVEFINHINNGLHECGFVPKDWFNELHEQFDASMGKDNVSRHIIEAIQGTEFELIYT